MNVRIDQTLDLIDALSPNGFIDKRGIMPLFDAALNVLSSMSSDDKQTLTHLSNKYLSMTVIIEKDYVCDILAANIVRSETLK